MVYNLHLLKTRRPRQHVKYESKPKLDTCSTAKNKLYRSTLVERPQHLKVASKGQRQGYHSSKN